LWDGEGFGREGVRERAGEVVGGDLVGGDEGFFDEVLGPGVEDVVVLGEVGGVVGAVGVGEGHEDHVAAFFEGHGFGVALWVACEGVSWLGPSWVIGRIEECTCSVGKCCADVVDGVAVGPVTGFLVDEDRVEKVFE
jgi:hypothetical protein